MALATLGAFSGVGTTSLRTDASAAVERALIAGPLIFIGMRRKGNLSREPLYSWRCLHSAMASTR